MSHLPAVTAGPSGISAPSSKALHLKRSVAQGDPEAYLVGTEFAHLHGDGSGSLHLTLPRDRAGEAIDKGWAELHPAVRLELMAPTLVMLYGPRDEHDLETVWRLIHESYAFARDPDWPRALSDVDRSRIPHSTSEPGDPPMTALAHPAPAAARLSAGAAPACGKSTRESALATHPHQKETT